MPALSVDSRYRSNIKTGVLLVTHYLIAQIKINDDKWIPEYAANVLGIVTKHGGKYLSRSTNITSLEGESLGVDLVAILSFPSMNALRAFLSDPEYAPFAKARQAGTDSHFIAIDATDAANAIPYLEASA